MVEAGWVGVQLFFVLSGFLITGILLDDRARPARLRVFYLRRVLRIFPLYYAFLVLYFVVLPFASPSLRRPFPEVIWYWLYLSNWSTLAYGLLPGMGHVWSLAVEEQFYVVWPWVAGRVRDRTFAWVCAGVIVASFAARVTFHRLHFDDLWLYASTASRVDALAMGALVALAFRSDVWRPRLERALRPLAIASAVGLLAVVAVTHGINRNHPLMQVYGYGILGVACAVLVAVAARPGAPRGLSHPFLRFFGKYSYGIYVIHPALKVAVLATNQRFFDERSAAHPIAFDVAFIAGVGAVSVGLALATWRVIEQPFLRLKDRLAPR